jgi:hypothetical protein
MTELYTSLLLAGIAALGFLAYNKPKIAALWITTLTRFLIIGLACFMGFCGGVIWMKSEILKYVLSSTKPTNQDLYLGIQNMVEPYSDFYYHPIFIVLIILIVTLQLLWVYIIHNRMDKIDEKIKEISKDKTP